jgi:membrane-associated phospholipid phosphatase
MIPSMRPGRPVSAARRYVPLLAGTLYVLLTVAVLAGWPGPVDQAVADALRPFGRAHPTLIDTVRILTDVAATELFLAAGLILGALLRVRGERPAAYLTWAATALVPILWSLSHLLLTHTRPPDAFIELTSNGFPSGHTANATTIALLAALLLRRPAVWVAALAFAGFVGMTRLLLLAHYPSQVLGGFLLATTVVFALARVPSFAPSATVPRA